MIEVIENNKKVEFKTGERQLNFELLRVISMILILLHHYSLYGGLVDLESIGANKIVGLVINMGGKLGAIIFILISGYFMIEKSFKIKKLLKLIFETIFYSLAIVLILMITNHTNFSIKIIIKSILPISYNQYWFITFYVGIYIFSPFINKLAASMNRKEYKILLFISCITLVVLPTIIISGDSFYNGFIYFIFLYLVGGYIRKYDIIVEKRKIRVIICIILLFMVFCSVLCMYLSTRINIANKGTTYFTKANSIPIFILGISIFLRFKEIKINNNTLIEVFGKTSLAVYLISDNPNLRFIIWKDIFKIQEFFTANTFILLVHILLTILTIYITCSTIDLLRIKFIEQPIFNIKKLNQIFEKIDTKLRV